MNVINIFALHLVSMESQWIYRSRCNTIIFFDLFSKEYLPSLFDLQYSLDLIEQLNFYTNKMTLSIFFLHNRLNLTVHRHRDCPHQAINSNNNSSPKNIFAELHDEKMSLTFIFIPTTLTIRHIFRKRIRCRQRAINQCNSQ